MTIEGEREMMMIMMKTPTFDKMNWVTSSNFQLSHMPSEHTNNVMNLVGEVSKADTSTSNTSGKKQTPYDCKWKSPKDRVKANAS
jgi:hypothetical protein